MGRADDALRRVEAVTTMSQANLSDREVAELSDEELAQHLAETRVELTQTIEALDVRLLDGWEARGWDEDVDRLSDLAHQLRAVSFALYCRE